MTGEHTFFFASPTSKFITFFQDRDTGYPCTVSTVDAF